MRTIPIGLAFIAAAGGGHAQMSDRWCTLDGKLVAECVRLVREANAAEDAEAKARLSEQAQAALAAAQERTAATLAKFRAPEESAIQRQRPPLQRYREHITTSLLVCRLAYENALLDRELRRPPSPNSDLPGCIAVMGAKGRELYGAAMALVRKEASRQALKEVHVAFSTALQGISPRNETANAYGSRQASLEDRLNAALARLDLEQ